MKNQLNTDHVSHHVSDQLPVYKQRQAASSSFITNLTHTFGRRHQLQRRKMKVIIRTHRLHSYIAILCTYHLKHNLTICIPYLAAKDSDKGTNYLREMQDAGHADCRQSITR